MAWLRTIRMMLKGALKAPSPEQIALAVAMGLAVGLVPKGNLLAFSLGVLMCALRLNLPVALAVAVFVSFGAHFADPVFDLLGGWVLEAESLRPAWIWLSERPYSAWLEFNNTIVMGAFVVAICQIYPTYRLTLPCTRWLVPKVIEKLQKSALMRWWSRFEWTNRIGSASQA